MDMKNISLNTTDIKISKRCCDLQNKYKFYTKSDMDKYICPICNCEIDFNNLFFHLAEEHPTFADQFDNEITLLVVRNIKYNFVQEVVEKITKKFSFIPKDKLTRWISTFIRDFDISHRKSLVANKKRHSPLTNDYVSGTSFIEAWEGVQPFKYTIEMERNIYRQLHDWVADLSRTEVCPMCYKEAPIYFIDGDEQNTLLTNLQFLHKECVENLPFVMISKVFTFAAAHYLPYHKGLCQYLHGHEWELEVTIKGHVQGNGMVMDYSDLKEFINVHVLDKLDHNVLNEFVYNPTAENLLVWIWDALQYAELKGIHEIRLTEARNSHAFLDVDGMLSIGKK